MFRFEDLEIWQESVKYGGRVYAITKKFPKDELFGLTSQIRRAVVSISSNIAEGSGATTKADFSKFLDIATKSALETVSQLFFAAQANYLNKNDIQPLYEEAEILIRRIRAFRNKL